MQCNVFCNACTCQHLSLVTENLPFGLRRKEQIQPIHKTLAADASWRLKVLMYKDKMIYVSYRITKQLIRCCRGLSVPLFFCI